MKALNIIVIILLITNIVLPFILEGSVNKWSSGLGWGLAVGYYYIIIST